MVVAVALGAALCYAVATVLQQHGARRADAAAALRPRLLLGLLRDPLWVVGIAANGIGFLLRFKALGRGSLVLVQPLLVSGLLFALPLGALVTRRRMHRREWSGACAIAAGLSLFLVAAAPTRGRADAPFADWALLGVALGVPALALVGVARRLADGRRAAVLAGAAGLLLGPTAALMKVSATLLRGGLGDFLTHWSPYGLVVVGVVAMLVVQSAFQAGSLSASLPVLAVVEPVVSVAVGAWLFHERVGRGALAPVAEVVGLVLVTIGVLVVTSSPIVAGETVVAGAVAPGRMSG